ncbi:hypothetical protein [Edaphobacter sp. 12200R-103]|uniref:hypothetical protein n=1 Tax=Edaphobacter sp. 12200R-103 TaxID=2703788 RepID=UPI00138BA55C|nr:hypothetical protein [Edaphobacter sp. 12200R-103]QHS51234.1 hypothetical protein GWR55_05400 [Edaphobacter sp. 12200R-103]
MDESPTRQIPSSNLKFAWLVLGCSFVGSLIASVTMIVRTINWIRLRGATVPSSYTVITQLSEWIFGLSSAGLLILAVIAILRSYQKH